MKNENKKPVDFYHGIYEYKGEEFPEHVGQKIHVWDDHSNTDAPCYKIQFVGSNEEIDNMDDCDIDFTEKHSLPESKEVESVPVKSADEILDMVSQKINETDFHTMVLENGIPNEVKSCVLNAMETYASQFKTNPIQASEDPYEQLKDRCAKMNPIEGEATMFSTLNFDDGCTDSPKIAAYEGVLHGIQWQKEQATNPIEVIKKRVAELEESKSSMKNIFAKWVTSFIVSELNHILKLIQ